VDRKGRPPEFVEHPTLTLVLTPQPIVMAAVMRDPIMRERGLVARFLYVVPETRQGRRNTRSAPLSDETVDAWANLIQRIFAAVSPPDARQNRQNPAEQGGSGLFCRALASDRHLAGSP